MRYLLWGIAAAAALYLIDRLGLWLEQRGWIYYRKHKASSGSLGNAFLAIQTALEPSKRHILEERLKKGPATQESGDKPKTGASQGGK